MPRTDRSTLIRAASAFTATVGLVAAGLVATIPADAAGQAGSAKAHKTPTDFALRTSGYGTRVKGGQVPAQSGTTAYDVIGCTNTAGITRENHQASTALPGLGTVSGVTTHVWTTKKGDVVSSWSRHKVASVVLSDSPMGTLKINAVQTTARAFHDAKGFHSDADTEIGGLSFVPPTGPAMTLPLPAPGKPVDIPGFGTVTLGHSVQHKNAHSARVFANGLKVDLTASGSEVHIAHAQAEIFDGIVHGIFHGSAAGLSGNLGGGVADLGRNPLSLMPCQGTDGKVLTKSLASAQGSTQLALTGLHNEQKAKQNDAKSWGFERSTVASLNLGGGQLEVTGIVGQANVTRGGGKITRSIDGTQVGTVTANGQAQTFPDTGVIEIPGVAKLERGVVTKLSTGLQVIGLRITLLDGSGAVIDLATAKLKIGKSGR